MPSLDPAADTTKRLPTATRLRASGLVLGLVAMLAFAPSAAAGISVTITDFQFSPTKMTVPQGALVEFNNASGGTTHSVTSDGTLAFWPSTDIPNATNFVKQFHAAGTFPYHCRFHSSMHGKIKVPVLVESEKSGTFDFKVTAGDADWAAASPYRNIVQVRTPASAAWTTISQSRHAVVHYSGHAGSGDYSFRSAVRRATNGAMSLWSKVVTIGIV